MIPPNFESLNYQLELVADRIGKYFDSFLSSFDFKRDHLGLLTCIVRIGSEAKNDLNFFCSENADMSELGGLG